MAGTDCWRWGFVMSVPFRSAASISFSILPKARRGLGTYGALHEIEFAAGAGIDFYYLGYWVQGCRKMEYKADFRPCEALYPDGCWREVKDR